MARKYNLYEGETIPSGELELDEAGYPVGTQPSNFSGLKNLYSGVKSAFAPGEGYSPDWETKPMEFGNPSYTEDRTTAPQGLDIAAIYAPAMLNNATRVNIKRDPNPRKYNVEKSFGLLPNAEQYGLKLKRDGMPDTSLLQQPQSQPQPQQDSGSNAVSPQTQKPGFFDWFKNMPEDKKQALNMGLLSAGLNIMASAGRTSPTPISTMGLIGEGGMQGLNMYQNVDRYNKDMGMRDAYLGFAKQAAGQSQTRFEAEQPYFSEQATRENEIQKALLSNAQSPKVEVINLGEHGTILKDKYGNIQELKAPGGKSSSKTYKDHVARQKEIISWVVPNEADFFAKLFELKDSAQKEALIAANPSTIEKLKKELDKPENAKYKAQWLISEKYTDEYLYGQGGGNTASNFPQENNEGQPKADYGLGNIDINNRPVVNNKDGSISTIRSISVNEDGKSVLIPTISDDGRIMSNEEAIKQYRSSGKHLGKFNTEEEATVYAKQLSRQMGIKKQIGNKNYIFDNGKWYEQ